MSISKSKDAMILFRTVILIAFCVSAYTANAQDISAKEITWFVDSLTDVQSGAIVKSSSEFVTKANTIQWIQKNGTRIYDFKITGKNNSWLDITTDGSFEYSVSMSEKNGTIKISRTSGDYSIDLEYKISDTETLHYTFQVSRFELR